MSMLDSPLGLGAFAMGPLTNARLADSLRGRRWRIRTGVQDLRFELRGSRDRRFEPGDPLATLSGMLAESRIAVTMPEVLVNAILARAPEAVTLAALEPHDAGLMFEHLLTEQIEALEATLGLPIRFDRLEQGGAAGSGGAWFEVDLPDLAYPVHVAVELPRVAEALASAVFEQDRTGPGVIPGMTVAIGPVNLARSEVTALQSGDEMLLEGASLDRLVGAVLLDERHYWPILLVDGGIIVDGTLQEAELAGEDDRAVQCFFVVGTTAEASGMKRGDRMPLQRVDDKRMVLRLGDRVLGRAGLVSLPDGLAIRFFGRDG